LANLIKIEFTPVDAEKPEAILWNL